MNHASLRVAILSAVVVFLLAACQQQAMDEAVSVAPVAGFVTDVARFDSFIASRPTPAQFRAAYPDVQLVLPGDMTTREYRDNNSRYFAELDKSGRIVGGSFQ